MTAEGLGFERIPAELRGRPQWVTWRFEVVGGRRTKVPYTADGKGQASHSNPSTWGTFGGAVATFEAGRVDGVGFVFTEGDPYIGIDLDHYRDPETGALDPDARRLVERFGTYAEVSPSGTGVHLIARGAMPEGRGRRKKPSPEREVEVYDRLRFFTITGEVIDDLDRVVDANGALHELLAWMRPPERGAAVNETPEGCVSLSDDELLRLVRRAKDAPKFDRLIGGDKSDYGGDDSRADVALCCFLARGSRDREQIDRIFRSSGLMRSKWEREDYRSSTIKYAFSKTDYRPSLNRRAASNGSGGDTARPAEGGDNGARPSINCYDRGLRDLDGQPGKADDALRILVDAHQVEPTVFERARTLVRIGQTKAGPDGGDTYPVVEALTKPALAGELAKLAWFTTLTDRGPINIAPSSDLVQDLHARGDWSGLHSLAGVVQTPVVRRDGTLFSNPGYDPASWLYYAPPSGFTVPPVSQKPSDTDFKLAVELVAEAFHDFPFATRAARAGAWALQLSPFVRPMLPSDECTPLAVVDAPTEGTGKGLLLDLTAIVATGALAPKRTAATDNDEWRKELLAAAIEGQQYYVIDNVPRGQTLGGAALDSAITAGRVQGRLLGFSRNITASILWTWVATGNNVVVGGDLARRCYWIRIVSDLADPTMRTEFLHPDLLAWARAERSRLVWAVLTIIRRWVSDGQPQAEVPAFGSFGQWAQLVGSILAHAGIEGFLEDLGDRRRRSDHGRDQWEAFVAAWWEVLRDEWQVVGDVARRMLRAEDGDDDAPLRDALPSSLAKAFDNAKRGSERGLTVALGKALSNVADRWYGSEPQLRFERDEDSHRKTATWRVTVRPDFAGDAGDAGDSGTVTHAQTCARACAGRTEEIPPASPASPANNDDDWEDV